MNKMIKKIFPTILIVVLMFAFTGVVYAFNPSSMPGQTPGLPSNVVEQLLGSSNTGGTTGGDTFQAMSQKLINLIINPLIAVLFAVALLYFLWGVVKYIGKGDEEGEREKARQMIIHGIIALAVMTAVWGLVAMVTNTFFASGMPQTPSYPSF